MRRLFIVALILAGGAPLVARDWPQYLGPARNGVYSGPALADAWPATGPRVVWKRDVGQGLSGPVVADGRLILFHRVGNREVVEALDPATGVSRWRYDYPTNYRDDFGFDEGPRAVPVVAGGIVYTFGAEGQLHAVDLASGTRKWSDDTMRHFDVAKGFFGAAGSPLVEDGRVIANIGGAHAGVVAFNASTGKVLWQATDDAASYSSGMSATIGGRQAAVFLTRNGILGLAPDTGRVLFQQPWRSRSNSSVNVATPLVVDSLLFVTAEYGPGAGAFRVEGAKLVPVWTSNDVLSSHYATPVYRDGILYGFHGRQEYGPSLRAVELATGRVRWSVDQFRAGSVTLAGDRLLIVRESGEIVLAAATPDAYRPLARAQPLGGVVRAFPALSDGLLFVRNERTLICLDLRR
jgi:outer membrane protein assembly factor BamB